MSAAVGISPSSIAVETTPITGALSTPSEAVIAGTRPMIPNQRKYASPEPTSPAKIDREHRERVRLRQVQRPFDERQAQRRRCTNATNDLPRRVRDRIAGDARPFHIDRAGRPAHRDADRDQQADQRALLRERIDQDRHAGDAQASAMTRARVSRSPSTSHANSAAQIGIV